MSNQSSTHYSRRNKRIFDKGGRPQIRSPHWHRTLSEDNFSAKKAGAVFVNLTADCDTVWHGGITCKLLRLLVCYPTRTWSAWSWSWLAIAPSPLPPATGGDRRSRLRRRRNGVPQGFVLASLLKIYTSDLPNTITNYKTGPSPRGVLVDLASSSKAPSPPKLKHETL